MNFKSTFILSLVLSAHLHAQNVRQQVKTYTPPNQKSTGPIADPTAPESESSVRLGELQITQRATYFSENQKPNYSTMLSWAPRIVASTNLDWIGLIGAGSMKATTGDFTATRMQLGFRLKTSSFVQPELLAGAEQWDSLKKENFFVGTLNLHFPFSTRFLSGITLGYSAFNIYSKNQAQASGSLNLSF